MAAAAAVAMAAGTLAASAETAVRQNNSASQSIELTGADTLAGKIVNVDLNMFTNNECEGYTITVEYDSDLQFKRVNGGATYNQEGNLIRITGFTPYSFEDGKIGSITFEVPDDAKENEIYDVKIAQVKDFGTLEENYQNYTTVDAQIKVIGTANKTSNYMVFVTEINNEANIKVGVRGDVNDDGNVDIFDAVAVAQSTVGKAQVNSEASRYFGNVNEDESFDIFDAISIAKYTTSNDWSQVIK